MSDKRKKAASAAKLAKDKMACNKPQKTPSHPTKSHVVKACKGGEEKIIRFGQQGVEGAGKNPKTAEDKARKKSYYARHNAQDPNPDKMSARYWSHRVKWQVKSSGILKRLPNNPMAKPKAVLTLKLESKPKKTRQGQGQNSLPNHGRKKTRGQGR